MSFGLSMRTYSTQNGHACKKRSYQRLSTSLFPFLAHSFAHSPTRSLSQPLHNSMNTACNRHVCVNSMTQCALTTTEKGGSCDLVSKRDEWILRGQPRSLDNSSSSIAISCEMHASSLVFVHRHSKPPPGDGKDGHEPQQQQARSTLCHRWKGYSVSS